MAVVPAYNEEKSIEAVVREICTLQSGDFEVRPLVINDGSTDRTLQVLQKLSKSYKMSYVNLPVNLGIGKAVQTGFKVALLYDAYAALQVDGDGQHPASEIPKLIAPLLARKADVVIGSRYSVGGSGNVSSLSRELGTRFLSQLLRTLTGIEITDATSGFRAFSRESLQFLASYYPDDFPEVQAYVSLARRQFKVLEVPVTMRKRDSGRSSISFSKSVYYMFKVSLATLLETFRQIPVRRDERSDVVSKDERSDVVSRDEEIK